MGPAVFVIAILGCGGLDFPVVVAQCKSAGTPASLELRPDEVKLPDAASERRRTILMSEYRPESARRR